MDEYHAMINTTKTIYTDNVLTMLYIDTLRTKMEAIVDKLIVLKNRSFFFRIILFALSIIPYFMNKTPHIIWSYGYFSRLSMHMIQTETPCKRFLRFINSMCIGTKLSSYEMCIMRRLISSIDDVRFMELFINVSADDPGVYIKRCINFDKLMI
jgi:hypothetical protein